MTQTTQEQYRQATERMIADYRTPRPVSTQQRRHRQVLIGHSWCAEIHRLAEASLMLVDSGFEHEANILTRTAWEMTISLHWLVQKGDAGALGIVAEGDRASRASMQDMKTGFTVPQDLVDMIENTPVVKTEESEVFRRFQAQCREIDPKMELYSVYRHLCGYAHPSMSLLYPFLDERRNPPGLLKKPKPRTSTVEATLAMCLIWGGRAFDELVMGKPRKQFLRGIARELQLLPILPYIG